MKTSLVAVAVMTCVQQVDAQTVTRYEFDVPRGPRDEVVREIARIGGSIVSLSHPDAPGLSEATGRIKGNFTLAEALEKALAGSEWYVAAAGNDQVRIARTGENSSDIIVTAFRGKLRKEDSSLLTRSDTPLKQTPGTVVSVSQAVLASQNVTSLEEALRNLPGISFTPGPPFLLSSRAGVTNGTSFTNGLRNASRAGPSPVVDAAAIEVLKGPSSVLSGTAVAGGLLNIVPKLATGVSPDEISIGGGTYGYVRGSADVGGAISEEDRLYWRFVGLSEFARQKNQGGDEPSTKSGTFLLGYRNDGWKIDSITQYYNTRSPFSRRYVNDTSQDRIIDVDDYFSRDTYYQNESIAQQLQLERNLVAGNNFELRMRARGRYQRANESFTNINCLFGCIGDVPVLVTAYRGKSDQYSGSADFYAKLVTGRLEQQLIVAFDYAGAKGTNFDVSDFGFGLPAPSPLAIPTASTPGVLLSQSRRRDYGVVVQDQINWGRFHALLSLRQTWFHERLTNDDPLLVPVETNVSKLLPTGGVVFDATKWASIYYSYQKGITPPQQFARQANGDLLPPAITTGHEVGAKFELFNSRMSITANYFRSTTSNQPLPNPANPLIFIPVEGRQVDGFELAQVGRITPTLFLQSGFVYTRPKTEVSRIGQPKYVANAWLLKTVGLGDKRSLDLGFGANYQSKAGILFDDFITGARSYPRVAVDYLRFDAAIGITSGPLKLNLTVDNIFDRLNLYNPSVADSLARAPGRDVRLVLTLALPGAR
ncbi:TonB-dependent siderophore receptor [Sphingomonas carotinifaciens]|nr:TonB-dependent receptor [Sphingomonas carotinifaciens]